LQAETKVVGVNYQQTSSIQVIKNSPLLPALYGAVGLLLSWSDGWVWIKNLLAFDFRRA
jgi:hypothetical protein